MAAPMSCQSVRVLLHFSQFCIQRQVRHPPYGPWNHVPPHVWTDEGNLAATEDEGEDEIRSVCCVVTSAPPPHFVISVRST